MHFGEALSQFFNGRRLDHGMGTGPHLTSRTSSAQWEKTDRKHANAVGESFSVTVFLHGCNFSKQIAFIFPGFRKTYKFSIYSKFWNSIVHRVGLNSGSPTPHRFTEQYDIPTAKFQFPQHLRYLHLWIQKCIFLQKYGKLVGFPGKLLIWVKFLVSNSNGALPKKQFVPRHLHPCFCSCLCLYFAFVTWPWFCPWPVATEYCFIQGCPSMRPFWFFLWRQKLHVFFFCASHLRVICISFNFAFHKFPLTKLPT